MSFKVAVLGDQDLGNFLKPTFGIRVFDLSVDQICSLLENLDADYGIDTAKLGANLVVTYQVMGGGRFYPSVSREEIAQAMQGVDILVSCVSASPWSHGFFSESFFSCLISDNLLTQCKAVIVRVVPWKDYSKYSRTPKPSTVKEVLKRCGLDSSNLQEKLYVIADKKVSLGKHRTNKGGNKAKLYRDTVTAIAQLRSSLRGEEVKEVVTRPVKETLSAGKALLGIGERFSSWVTSIIKS